jgi:hypothetical protein
LSAQALIVSCLLVGSAWVQSPDFVGPSWMNSSSPNPSPLPGADTPGLLSNVPLWYAAQATPPQALPLTIEPPRNDNGYLESLFDDSGQTTNYYDPFSRQFAYGSAGAQPYRLGWYSYDDFVWMPNARASIGGNFQDLEWNAWLRYSNLVRNSLVFSWTGAFNSKWWAGPTGIDFPPYGNQLVSDFQLSSHWSGGWNWQLGVTPQINSDFTRTLNSNALMFDVRAVALFRPAPEWTVAVGVAFWNRATDHLIPYGGVIWAPNDRWEFRLLFPRSRISYYAGNYFGCEAWGYVSLEYNIDAYQLDFQDPHVSTRGELDDFRLLKGFNLARGRWNFFWEGGAVFDRHVRFRCDVGDFGINEGLMIRTGITY